MVTVIMIVAVLIVFLAVSALAGVIAEAGADDGVVWLGQGEPAFPRESGLRLEEPDPPEPNLGFDTARQEAA